MRHKLETIILWAFRHRFDLVVMTGLAALNLPLLFSVPHQFNFDTSLYLVTALNFADGRGFTMSTGYPNLVHPVLFSLFLAFAVKITHGVALSAVWLVKIFAIFTAWAVYALGKNLFSRGTGVLGAVMVTFSLIFRQSYQSAVIDTIATFFLLVGLLFSYFAFKRRGAWLLLSGLSMGLAFLQKEVSIIWAFIPWLLYFIDWRYRRNVRLIDLWAYTVIVAIPVTGWMLWSYHWAGQMYPMSKSLTTLVIRWGGFGLLLAMLASLLFDLLVERSTRFSMLFRGQWWRRICLGLIVAIVIMASPIATTLMHSRTRLSLPWVEIPNYVAKYIEYFPAFALVVFACGFVIARSILQGSKGTTFGTLALVVGFPLLTGIAHVSIPPRQIMGVMIISYVLLAGVLCWGLGWLQQWRVGYGLGRLVVLGFLLGFIWHQNVHFKADQINMRSREESPHVGWFNYHTVAPIANWIRENVPPGTPLLTNYWLHHELFYEAAGRYPVFSFPVLQTDFDPSLPDYPFSPVGYAGPAYYPAQEFPLDFADYLYIGYRGRERVFYAVTEKDTLAWLQDNQIEYLILAGDMIYNTTSYIDYFASNPAFELVFQGRYQPYLPVYMYRVNLEKWRFQGQYPLVISPIAFRRMLNEEAVTDITGILCRLPRPVVLRPLTKNDTDLAALLANSYLEEGRLYPALNLYKAIVALLPTYGDQQLTQNASTPTDYLALCIVYIASNQMTEAKAACNRVVDLSPELPAVYVALGEIALTQDRPERAVEYYYAALEIESDITAYIRLGDAYRVSGQLQRAQAAYQHVAVIEPTNQIAQMHLVETIALSAQADRQWDLAVNAYRKAIDLYPDYWPVALASDKFEMVKGDLVSEGFALSLLNSKVKQNIFVINRRPMRVLPMSFASSVDFQTGIPRSAELAFTLGVSPEVWQTGRGDGVQFDIYIDDGHIQSHPFSEYIDPKTIPAHRRWHDHEIDLSRWAGQTVTITFATGPGPNGNSDYDWAGWGEPRIVQPIAYNFLTELPNANHSAAEEEQIRQDTLIIDYEPRVILFQHPSSQVVYRVDVPGRAGLHFGLGMAPAVWSPDKGDGVEYNIYVQRPDEPYKLYRVFHRYLDPKNNPEDRRWLDQVVDLSAYGGETVDVVFEALPGPAGDANFDWGGWSTPVLVGDDMALLNADTQLTVGMGE